MWHQSHSGGKQLRLIYKINGINHDKENNHML